MGEMSLELRDITQAYSQAQSTLKRVILAALPMELEGRYPANTILRVIRPLYGLQRPEFTGLLHTRGTTSTS
jgi:hypothetical protein